MPIFDQGYQHWQGDLTSQIWRWWAITWHSVRMQLRSKWTRFCLIACTGPVLTLVIVLILWSLLEQGNSWLQPILAILPAELRRIPQEYRLTVWTLAFHIFFLVQFFFVMILVLMVGPDLISKDMRFNALPLYLSRPVRRWEYFLGKLGVIGFYILLVMAAPATLAWLLGALFSLSFTAIAEVFPLLVGSWLISIIVMVSCGLLMLALSSLSRNSRYVAMMWFAFWLFTNMSSGLLFGLLRGEEWALPISYTRNLQRIEEQLLNTEKAWTKLEDMMNLSAEIARKQAGPGAALIPGLGSRSGRPGSAVRDEPRPFRFGLTSMRRGTEASGPLRSIYPWQWSAFVLAGLGVFSLCILMFRVKSLDRLR